MFAAAVALIASWKLSAFRQPPTQSFTAKPMASQSSGQNPEESLQEQSSTSGIQIPLASGARQTKINPHTMGSRPRSSGVGIKWGVYAGNSPRDYADFESRVERQTDLEAVFVAFGDEFPLELAARAKEKNKTLVIFWEPHNTSLDNIIAGESDDYISEFASAAKNYESSLILAPFHEMNGNWNSWGGTVNKNTPAKIISAWRKIHDLFKDAANVKFGWAVNNESIPDITANRLENYYPGNKYVDYVGVDGFNFGQPWQSFNEIFDNALSKISVYNKPIYIFSFASAADPKKAEWITDALTAQIPKYPRIEGWIWFNQNKEKDWRVWSDEKALEAFRGALLNY